MGALCGTGKATLFSLFIAPHGTQNLPEQGSNPSPLQGKRGILTAGGPGKSREVPLDAVGTGTRGPDLQTPVGGVAAGSQTQSLLGSLFWKLNFAVKMESGNQQ